MAFITDPVIHYLSAYVNKLQYPLSVRKLKLFKRPNWYIKAVRLTNVKSKQRSLMTGAEGLTVEAADIHHLKTHRFQYQHNFASITDAFLRI